MTRVVERCATCGVEHEVRVEECEACGGALRYWCRVHSSDIGWLEGAECRGCVEERARPQPARPAPARPQPARPAGRRPRPAVASLKHPRKEIDPALLDALAPMPAHEWVEAHIRAVLAPMLWTIGVFVIPSMATGVYVALRRGHDMSESLVVHLILGLVAGLLSAGVVAAVRLVWLSRRGGPLDDRRKPV